MERYISLFILIAINTFFLIIFFIFNVNPIKYKFNLFNFKSNEGFIDFTNFNNEIGSGSFIVPNWIHLIRLGNAKMEFFEAVCIIAAVKNQKPDYIFIHTDTCPEGKYWNTVKKAAGKSIRLMNVTAPDAVFGQKLPKAWKKYHGSDILRLRILRTYGGIYLDSDTYLVRSIDHYRRFEIALGWSNGKPLQNQIIVAHRDARLLKLWLKGYQDDYQSNKWYYNAGDLPTSILQESPHLAHAVPKLFGNYGVIRNIFQRIWPEWRNYYAIHLMIRHQYLLKNITNVASYPVKFNEDNIHLYNITFRDMVYDVYPYT